MQYIFWLSKLTNGNIKVAWTGNNKDYIKFEDHIQFKIV